MKHKHHFRRCHVCGRVSEQSDSLVDQCRDCGKIFAPFYFFDEESFLGASDLGEEFYEIRLDSNLKITDKTYRPLWGLTAFW